jgi:hypothetical protein
MLLRPLAPCKHSLVAEPFRIAAASWDSSEHRSLICKAAVSFYALKKDWITGFPEEGETASETWFARRRITKAQPTNDIRILVLARQHGRFECGNVTLE